MVSAFPTQWLKLISWAAVCEFHSCLLFIITTTDRFGPISPLVPGHEIIGRIAALGEGVTGWSVGDRVGGGWHGGHDGRIRLARLPQEQKWILTHHQAPAKPARKAFFRCVTTQPSTARQETAAVSPGSPPI